MYGTLTKKDKTSPRSQRKEYVGNSFGEHSVNYVGYININIKHIFLHIGNIQISILLLCFLYLFVELMITMNE